MTIVKNAYPKLTSKFVVKLQNMKFNYRLLFLEPLTFTIEYKFGQIIQSVILFIN